MGIPASFRLPSCCANMYLAKTHYLDILLSWLFCSNTPVFKQQVIYKVYVQICHLILKHA